MESKGAGGGEIRSSGPGTPGAAAVGGRKRSVLPGWLIIGGGICLFFGVFGTIGGLLIQEPVIPPGTPSEVTTMTPLDDPAGLSTNGTIAYRSDPYGFDVSFDEANVDPPTQAGDTPLLQSIDGDWYGTDASLTVNAVERGTAEPSVTGSDWGESLPDHAERTVSPTLRASLPISADDLHTSLVVTADMRVHVPYKVGDSGFSVAGGTVRKSATFFVVSPDEMQLRHNLDDWKNRDSIRWGGVLFLGIGAALAAGGFALRRKRRSAV